VESAINQATSAGENTHKSRVLDTESVNNRILFNVGNLCHLPYLLDDDIGETTGVTLEVTVVHLTDANGPVSDETVFFLMNGLEEVEVVVCGGGGEIVLQHDDV